MFFSIHIYILHCSDGILYTGITKNLELRLQQHQTGSNKTAFTYSRRPVKLVYHEVLHDIFQARHYEKRIKKWSANKKWSLINGDFDKLKLLAMCQNDSSSAFVSSGYIPIKHRK
ncbi:GIY-YIG nuclease family protein [Nonlabens antarcticus]|uniref:GIY-YIG nuclease family protein n=1 Tax=Nonlabens antarcticus TaxID=392714 RepID=UPI001891007B|nr:GIY-YIG nuclease family protein [Nonlabens antarcticus]